MSAAKPVKKTEHLSLVSQEITEEITETDEQYFWEVVSTDLTEKQIEQILNPPVVFNSEKYVLAVHWHPEHIPMDLIQRRLDKCFPNRQQELIIPTQHNMLLDMNGYTGVEVDCYSAGFNQKVQLLLHFETPKVVETGHTLKKMLAHTFQYRASQLFDYIHSITAPNEERVEMAARQTGANKPLVDFVTVYVKKLESLLEKYADDIPKISTKNKVVANFFDCLRSDYDDALIDRVQNFLTSVKRQVKADFPLQYFYRTSEVIEEARGIGAGIVVPHPEQFWPILLADYDVDGIEVWNPQSQRYTNFLVSIINKKNQMIRQEKRKLLVFMGDDTHLGEKVKAPAQQRPEKVKREIGYQPSWEDLDIRKNLIRSSFLKDRIITEYKARLAK